MVELGVVNDPCAEYSIEFVQAEAAELVDLLNSLGPSAARIMAQGVPGLTIGEDGIVRHQP